jgi:hypothetical protein
MIKICKCGNKFSTYNGAQSRCPKCELSLQMKKQPNGERKRGYFDRFKKKTVVTTTKGIKSVKTSNLKPKRKSSELTKAKKRAWDTVSRYVRLLLTKNGAGKCYTCEAWHDIHNLDAGHFVTIGDASTRYHLDNIRLQCVKCNRFQQGVHHIFRDQLISELGLQRVETLEALARTPGDDSISHHNAIYEEFKVKLRDLERERGEFFWK